MASSPNHAFSYTTGTKGLNRVRLYADAKRSGALYVEYLDEQGRKKRLRLAHDDVQQGKVDANELAAALLQHEGPRSSELTLRALFDNYTREVTPTKPERAQYHEFAAVKMFILLWGPTTRVKDLDRRDWDRFIQQRRAGRLKPEGSFRAGGVGDRAIQADLKFLKSVLNRAETIRERGKPLIDRNPFQGFPMPSEANPRRPVLAEEEYVKLAAAAPSLGEDIALFLVLAHETGHRCTAVGRLRWSDVDLDRARVTFRATFDKKGREHTVPLSSKAIHALSEYRARAVVRSMFIGDDWIFKSTHEPSKPVRSDRLRDWWRRLEKRAGLAHVRGRGWHSLRRKFATDLKHLPLKDLMALGNWKDSTTVIKSYMQADEGTMRRALEERNAANGQQERTAAAK